MYRSSHRQLSVGLICKAVFLIHSKSNLQTILAQNLVRSSRLHPESLLA